MALLWLSLRVRWRRAWGRTLAVVLLIGGIGGFILAAAASARAVEGTYQTFIDDINAPDLVVFPGCEQPAAGLGCNEPSEPVRGAAIVERLEKIPIVEEARSLEVLMPYLLNMQGTPLLATDDDPYGCVDDKRSVSFVALVPGRGDAQGMPFRLDGELPTPGSSGVVVTLATAERAGLAVGDNVRLAGWCNGEGDRVEIDETLDLIVTGISVGPLDIEPPGSGQAIEPAFVDRVVLDRLVAAGAESQPQSIVWLDEQASPAAIQDELAQYEIVIDLRARAVVFDDALASDARLLWLLAGVGAMGALLLLTPIIGRHLHDTAGDTAMLLALGTTRKQIAGQALVHVGVLGLVGGLVAALIAPIISGLMPRGFAVRIAPDIPLGFDVPLTAIGWLTLVVAVVAMGALTAWRIASGGEATVKRVEHRRISGSSSHLRPAVRSGLLTAVGTPAGRRQASPWPSFLALAVAGATCVGSLTYLAGLRHFERTPSMVGWNWDAAIGFDDEASAGMPAMLATLGNTEGVDAVTTGTFYPPVMLKVADTDIEVWPWSFDTGPRAITPTITLGRAPDGPDEVAINPILARAADLDIGDSVSLARPSLVVSFSDWLRQVAAERDLGEFQLDAPDEPPVNASFEVTGIAILPLQRTQESPQATFTLEGLSAFVEPSDDEMTAALDWLPADLTDAVRTEVGRFFANTTVDGRAAYLRLSGDVPSIASAIARIEGVSDIVAPNPQLVLPLLVGLNVSNNDQLPLALVSVVSIASAALLCYLLYTAVRARRFEFAVLRALGLSGRGLRWSVAVQATATAIVPLVVAIPVGIAVGRWAWLTSARDLDVVAVWVTPWSALAVLVVSAIVIANLSVLVPGWSALRRSPGADLRAG